MSKTMYIPKGQECRFEDLTCERITVNGSLVVNGKLRTKHISGKGFVYAKWLTAKTVTADTVDADSIAADTLMAAHVNAYDVHVVQSITVSTHITANYVRTAHMTYADAEIRELQADEAIKLAPKRRGLFRTLLASFIRAKWAELTYGDKNAGHNRNGAETQTPPVNCVNGNAYAATQEQTYTAAAPCGPSPGELNEAALLLNDPEFLRLRSMWKLTKETGDIWLLAKKSEPTGRAVTAFTAA